jgi:hypothetical protein
MTTYATVTGTASYNRAKYKPHDKRAVRIVRNSHNANATSAANAVQINMFTIPADSILLGVWTEVTVASGNNDVLIDVGIAGGAEYADDVNSNQANGTVNANECLDNVRYCNAATIITCAPDNGNAWAAGTLTITAAYIELDSFGSAG